MASIHYNDSSVWTKSVIVYEKIDGQWVKRSPNEILEDDTIYIPAYALGLLIDEEDDAVVIGDDRILLNRSSMEYKIALTGRQIDYALIQQDTGVLEIADHATSQAILGRYTKVFEIENGESYEVHSTGNRLIYGLYNEITNDASPVENIYVSDTDNCSNAHAITNTVGAIYLVVYYQQGTMIGTYDAHVEHIVLL